MSFYKEVPGRKTTLESTLKFDNAPTEGSTNPVTSEGVKTAIDGAVGDAAETLQEQIDEIAEKAGSGYIPKGEASVATLNALSGQENGELYTMTDAGTLTEGSLAVVAGDTVAWNATNEVWYKAMDYAPRQYGTNEVHNLPTSITAFRSGDVIPVDGPSGTAKMSKDDLLQVTSSGEEQVDVTSLVKYNGSIKYSYQNTWYYITAANPKHVNIPLKKNWVYEITPTNGWMSAVISNSPSYDKADGDSVSGRIIYCKQDETCKVVGTGSNYLSVTVVDGGGGTLTYNVVAKFKGDNAVEEIPLYTERCTKYRGLPRYDKPMTLFPMGEYVAFEVYEGEIITLSPSIDCYFVMCNATFVPKDITSVTSAETEISSRQFSRIPIKKGEKVTLTIASDEKYLLVNTKDGANNSVTWEISSRSKPKTSAKTKFKFAQWNIGHFSMGTHPNTTITAETKAEKQAEYRSLINEVGADILAVCEDNFYFATDNTLSRPAIYDCYSKCRIGYQVAYLSNSLYFNVGEMVDERNWAFTQKDEFRYVHEIKLNINGENVIVAEIHLDWSNATRRRAQIAELITHYSNEKYVIISGDWNVMTDVSDYDAMKTAGYTLSLDDYLPALPTYPDQETCLDIVAVKGFTIGKSEINADSISLSDHNLVTCELTMVS